MTYRGAKADDAGRHQVQRRVHVLAVLTHVQHEALGEGRRQAGSFGHVREHIRHGAVHRPIRQPGATQLLPRRVPEVERCTGERRQVNDRVETWHGDRKGRSKASLLSRLLWAGVRERLGVFVPHTRPRHDTNLLRYKG